MMMQGNGGNTPSVHFTKRLNSVAQNVLGNDVTSRCAAFWHLSGGLRRDRCPAGDGEQIATAMAPDGGFQEGDDSLCFVAASTCVNVITLASRTFHSGLPALSGPFDITPRLHPLPDTRGTLRNCRFYEFLKTWGR